mmetsp:Transcript_142161/g.354238  ORF Transcript_142161/g.354238 Transcript_142161/m.354238 type:complete len:206 (+) Transcript_142161:354-971(+)
MLLLLLLQQHEQLLLLQLLLLRYLHLNRRQLLWLWIGSAAMQDLLGYLLCDVRSGACGHLTEMHCWCDSEMVRLWLQARNCDLHTRVCTLHRHRSSLHVERHRRKWHLLRRAAEVGTYDLQCLVEFSDDMRAHFGRRLVLPAARVDVGCTDRFSVGHPVCRPERGAMHDQSAVRVAYNEAVRGGLAEDEKQEVHPAVRKETLQHL